MHLLVDLPKSFRMLALMAETGLLLRVVRRSNVQVSTGQIPNLC
jgi:hypothetical protein